MYMMQIFAKLTSIQEGRIGIDRELTRFMTVFQHSNVCIKISIQYLMDVIYIYIYIF